MARNYITRASPKEIGSFFKRLLYPSTLLQFSPCYQEVPFFKKKNVNNYFSKKENFQIVFTGERRQMKERE